MYVCIYMHITRMAEGAYTHVYTHEYIRSLWVLIAERAHPSRRSLARVGGRDPGPRGSLQAAAWRPPPPPPPCNQQNRRQHGGGGRRRAINKTGGAFMPASADCLWVPQTSQKDSAAQSINRFRAAVAVADAHFLQFLLISAACRFYSLLQLLSLLQFLLISAAPHFCNFLSRPLLSFLQLLLI